MKTKSNTPMSKRRVIAGLLALLWLVIIFIFSAVPGASYPAHPGFLNYVAHFGEYFVLAALLTTFFTGSRLKPWQVILTSILIASAYAVSDELHQLFVPGRLCDPVDWATDTLGACAGACAAYFTLKKIDSKKSNIS